MKLILLCVMSIAATLFFAHTSEAQCTHILANQATMTVGDPGPGPDIQVCGTNVVTVFRRSRYRCLSIMQVVGTGAVRCGPDNHLPTRTQGWRVTTVPFGLEGEGRGEWRCVNEDNTGPCVVINTIETRYQYDPNNPTAE